jgi:ferredoxin
MQPPGFSGKACGLGEVTRKNGAEWIDFTKEKVDVPCPDGKVVKKFTLSGVIREADIIISLPKLKTHQLMYYTGAMKNIFGLIPSVAKSPFHARFSRRDSFAAMLVDLNLAVKPAYAFMDAVIGMEGSGPAAGNPRQVGLVMASSNLLALDVAATTVIGYPPGEVPTNKDALGRSLWLSSIAEIEYPGLTPADVRVPDFVKIPFKRTGSQLIDFVLPGPVKKWRDSRSPGPEINHAACIRCGDCTRICSPQAMSISGDKVMIDYTRCIRCFCCHEICPEKAINIKKDPKN